MYYIWMGSFFVLFWGSFLIFRWDVGWCFLFAVTLASGITYAAHLMRPRPEPPQPSAPRVMTPRQEATISEVERRLRERASFGDRVETPRPQPKNSFVLQLIVTSKDNNSRADSIVNPDKDMGMRPALRIVIVDKEYEARSLPLTLELLGPRKKNPDFSCQLEVLLRIGPNPILPDSVFILPENIAEGEWRVRLKTHGKIRMERTFKVTRATLASLEDTFGSDMEITPETERQARDLDGPMSLDDLL